MTAPTYIELETVVRLAPHMRLRFDQIRQTWAVQAPERTFMLDGIAHAIISRCDGATAIVGVVDELCVAFPEAPRKVIEKDVLVLLQRFADKGVVIA